MTPTVPNRPVRRIEPMKPSLRLYVVEYVDRGKTMVTVVEAVDKTVAQWLFKRDKPKARVVSVT